jgi:large subunit ribosomal protein L9
MKVILNKDLATLGEEGDVKDVAKGYFRNYLFPRGIALPYNESTVKLFETRKEEIASRKEEKRRAAASDKEKLEGVELVLTMPAGANGKLYGAVTNQTVADELLKLGFQIERKRIELPGNTFKSVGKYKVSIRLYEGSVAEIALTVQAQVAKKPETKPVSEKGRRQRRESPMRSTPRSVEPATETETAPQALTTEGAV